MLSFIIFIIFLFTALFNSLYNFLLEILSIISFLGFSPAVFLQLCHKHFLYHIIIIDKVRWRNEEESSKVDINFYMWMLTTLLETINMKSVIEI